MSVKKKPAPAPGPEDVPRDLESERTLLGLILLQGRSGYEQALAEGVRAEDFFSPANAAIFRAMSRLAAAGAPVEITSVRVELEDAGDLILAGGPAGLGKLIE